MRNKFDIDISDVEEFTLPVIKKQGQRWFIEFYYKGKRNRLTYELNRIKDLKLRERKFILYRNALEKKLLDGFNPEEENENDNQVATFEKAFQYGYNKVIKNIRPATLRSYESYLKPVFKTESYTTIKDVPVTEIKRKDLIDLFEEVELSKSVSVVNKAIAVFKIVFNKLIEYDVIEHSVMSKVKKRKEAKGKIVIATNDQVLKIKDHLESYLPNLWGLVLFIFHSGLRPGEVLSVKLNMINLKKRTIIIPKEYIKTNIERVVAIDNVLYNYISSMNINEYDSNMYLLGRGKNKDLSISEIKSTMWRIHYLWNTEVKTPLELDINLYSFKHLRANKELMINNNLEQAKVLFGHTDMKTTEIYANQKNEIFIERLKDSTLDLNNLK